MGVVDRTETGINVRCRLHWASALPIFSKPRITVDGRSEVRRWGRNFFPTSPGRHQVSVTFRWPGGPDPEANITVDVVAGQQIYLEFRTPLMFGFAFMEQPRFKVVSPPPVT